MKESNLFFKNPWVLDSHPPKMLPDVVAFIIYKFRHLVM